MCRQRYRAVLAVLAILWSGCTTVTPTPTEDRPILPRPRMAPECVVLEVGFVDVPHEPTDWMEQVWREIDEQQLAPDLRRAWHTNGLRGGVVGLQLPSLLRAALDERQEGGGARRSLHDLSAAAPAASPNRRIQARSGRRTEIVTQDILESIIVLVDDGEGVAGRTFDQAQPVLALKAFPNGDGSANLELIPEIQYGPPRQRWTGRANGMFQLEAGRDKQVFPHLKLDIKITPGQTLVVTADGPARSLGGNFFQGSTTDLPQKMLLIRLAQSQYDDLFAPIDPPEELQLLEDLEL